MYFLRVSLTRRLASPFACHEKIQSRPRTARQSYLIHHERKKKGRATYGSYGNRARSKYPAHILSFSTRFAVEPQESHEEIRNNERRRRSMAREKERQKKRKRGRERKRSRSSEAIIRGYLSNSEDTTLYISSSL